MLLTAFLLLPLPPPSAKQAKMSLGHEAGLRTMRDFVRAERKVRKHRAVGGTTKARRWHGRQGRGDRVPRRESGKTCDADNEHVCRKEEEDKE